MIKDKRLLRQKFTFCVNYKFYKQNALFLSAVFYIMCVRERKCIFNR